MKKKCQHTEFEVIEYWDENGIEKVTAKCIKCGELVPEVGKIFLDRAMRMKKIYKFGLPFIKLSKRK